MNSLEKRETPSSPQVSAMAVQERPFDWEGLIGVGTLFSILGVFALVAPVITSLGLAWLIGAIFLASGIALLVHAFRYLRDPGKVTRFMLAGLAIAAGLTIMRNPVAGSVAFTAVIAVYLLVSSVGRAVMAFEIRPDKGWGWLLLSSGISFVLGFYLIAAFPTASLMVPGVFFGVDLILFGGSLVSLALGLKRVRHRVQKVEEKRAA